MTSALIARADDGGLGVQTHGIAAHVPFDRILIVYVDPPRGVFRPERFQGLAPAIRMGTNPLRRKDIAWLLECDRIVTVEGFYNDTIIDAAHAAGRRCMVYANPELFPPLYRTHADAGRLDVYAPTHWETARLGDAPVVPQPVDTELIRRRVRYEWSDRVRSFLHVSAPAMLDRNGTDILRAALDVYVGPKINVYISGPEAPDHTTMINGQVLVSPLPDVADWQMRYNDDIVYDALLMPRRYGGLSLVMQESLAAGMPVLALAREPEARWGGVLCAPVSECGEYPMKGGRIPVADADPTRYADLIARFSMGDPEPHSRAAIAHAETIAWHTLAPRWIDTFAPQPTSSSTFSPPTG